MDTFKEYDVTVASGIISIFQRQNFKLDRVFSEFIDNSLQSYLDHKDVLDKLADGQKCKVSILWEQDKIIIKDNAYGMVDEEFARALKLKATNPNALRNNQLSVYGMGLKYASVYLGDHYSISTTAYQSSTRFFAEVDVPTFEKNNPETVRAKLSSDFEEIHETVITITDLRIKRTQDREKDLRDKLGIIYNHYIHSGKLSISINQIPITYSRPELRPKDDGGKYYEHFEDSFVISGNEYSFTGWIGILNKGDQSITGLNLVQADRCIELGYKPEKLFGKGNSFQNSRVVGEVVFNGDNYVLSFNKDRFVWADDGAEEAFIDKLSNNPQVAYIIKMSKELSFTDDIDKVKSKTKNAFKNNKNVKSEEKKQDESKKSDDVVKKPNDVKSTGESVKTVDPTQPVQPVQPTPPVQPMQPVEPVDNYDKYIILVNNKETALYVDIINGGSDEDWIKFDKYKDGYLVKINYENKFINDNFKNQASKAATNAIAILLATSMLKSQNNGLKLTDALLLLKTVNELMGDSDE